jgi:hypothetical protein
MLAGASLRPLRIADCPGETNSALGNRGGQLTSP